MASHNITDVTDASFLDEVLKSDKPVLIDFWAPWCGPCKAFAPTLQKFADAHPEVKVVKINTDDNKEASQGIRSIPSLVLVKDGKGLLVGTGNMSVTQVEDALKKGLEFFANPPTSGNDDAPEAKAQDKKQPKGPQL